ncbi:MAG TPA: hypothetical protein VG826_35450 [Pirellulales bacterium]|nr:hypothetical protein [Pirellulales bacterium]
MDRHGAIEAVKLVGAMDENPYRAPAEQGRPPQCRDVRQPDTRPELRFAVALIGYSVAGFILVFSNNQRMFVWLCVMMLMSGMFAVFERWRRPR